MNLGNCPQCGKLYVLNFREMCPDCKKEIERQYELCSEYLRVHRGSTMTELSEATEVTTRQITKFIREGRISVIDAPNLSYPCEVCGTALIHDSNMCPACRARLTKELSDSVKDQQSRNMDDKKGPGAYKAIDKYNK